MSYILEALRKSETERKQGEVPHLGSSVQMIHKPGKSGSSLILWIAVLALLANVVVLGWLFWPSDRIATISTPATVLDRVQEPVTPAPVEPVVETAVSVEKPDPQAELPPLGPGIAEPAASASGEVVVADPQPVTLIEPSTARDIPPEEESVIDVSLSVPTLGNMPAGFQRRVPDLIFNSHIYSTSPESRRVMINDAYLKEGARFQGLVVDEITEDGVILSLQGESFVVSVVRNWISPR